jgi:SAM-dependent methyltransferase
MPEGQYVAVVSPEDIEWERVGLIEALYDGITTRYLDALGVKAGWRCSDVGAGRGSIARWLAERVGPLGQVVAADLNPRLLRRASLPTNVEIREHNILTQDLEAAQYDLVHCRALLMHLPQPAVALERMAAAVRPGGWLCLGEPDFTPFGAVDPQAPGAVAFTQTFHACFDALRAAGCLDSTFGRRLLTLVEGLGFTHIRAAGEVLLGKGGSHPLGRFWRLSLRVPGVEGLVERGVVTREAFDQMCAFLDDPACGLVGSILFSVWGQRPSSGG